MTSLNLDQYEEVSSQMSSKQKEEIKIINRGHLGIPEDILKAGSQQYASMCGNINNKVSYYISGVILHIYYSLCCVKPRLTVIHGPV